MRPPAKMATLLKHLVTQEDYAAALAAYPKALVIDAYATWCGPCLQMAPFFEGLVATRPDVGFFKLDVDQAQDLASALHVTSLPTFVIVQGGRVTDTVVGANRTRLGALVRGL